MKSARFPALRGSLSGLARLMRLTQTARPEAPDKARDGAAEGAFRASGVLRVWNWTLPFLLGLAFGWFCMVCLEVGLNERNRRARPAGTAPASAGSAQNLAAESASAFLKANPFRVTPMPVDESGDPAEEGNSTPITGSLATAVLKGTSPGLAAWMEDQGQLRVVLEGQSFDVYTLEEVDYTEAVFVKEDERVVKELFYGGAPASPPARPQAAPTPPRAAVGQQFVAADPNKKEPGEVSRELVVQLLENPFDEMKKVRIRPSEAGNGLQVQWLNKGSLLGQLGIQRNDVISAINGIPLRNMGDVSNAINSLTNSDQFDLEIARGGTPLSLRYVVR
jgi:hypothetical protein